MQEATVPTPQKLLYSKREAAQLLSLSPRTIDNLIAAGELNPRRVGRRTLLELSELERFAKRDHSTRAK